MGRRNTDLVRTVALYFVGPPIVALTGVYGVSTAFGIEFSTVLVWLTIAIPLVWIVRFGTASIPTTTAHAHGEFPRDTTPDDIDSAELRTGTGWSATALRSYVLGLLSPSTLPLIFTLTVILGWVVVVAGLA